MDECLLHREQSTYTCEEDKGEQALFMMRSCILLLAHKSICPV